MAPFLLPDPWSTQIFFFSWELSTPNLLAMSIDTIWSVARGRVCPITAQNSSVVLQLMLIKGNFRSLHTPEIKRVVVAVQ